MKVLITSTNPVKVNAVKESFAKFFPDKEFTYEAYCIPSNVSNQPMSFKETYEGAKNRALNAKKQFEADFYIGMEGGLEKIDNEYHCAAWVYILGKKEGKAKTSTFILPNKFNEYLDKGMELGDAADIIFKEKNTKHGQATIGFLTNGLITRTDYYREAVILALININS